MRPGQITIVIEKGARLDSKFVGTVRLSGTLDCLLQLEGQWPREGRHLALPGIDVTRRGGGSLYGGCTAQRRQYCESLQAILKRGHQSLRGASCGLEMERRYAGTRSSLPLRRVVLVLSEDCGSTIESYGVE